MTKSELLPEFPLSSPCIARVFYSQQPLEAPGKPLEQLRAVGWHRGRALGTQLSHTVLLGTGEPR